MILIWFFDFSTGFRFSKISVECSLHLCSCPWANSFPSLPHRDDIVYERPLIWYYPDSDMHTGREKKVFSAFKSCVSDLESFSWRQVFINGPRKRVVQIFRSKCFKAKIFYWCQVVCLKCYQFHLINFVLSISIYQLHSINFNLCINFNLSISIYQFQSIILFYQIF